MRMFFPENNSGKQLSMRKKAKIAIAFQKIYGKSRLFDRRFSLEIYKFQSHSFMFLKKRKPDIKKKRGTAIRARISEIKNEIM